MPDIERCCEIMHDAYEKAAAGAGWETNLASRKPWADVPEANKITMRAAVGALLDELNISDLKRRLALAERGQPTHITHTSVCKHPIHYRAINNPFFCLQCQGPVPA